MSRTYPWPEQPQVRQTRAELLEIQRQAEALEGRRRHLTRQLEAAERAALEAWAATRPEVRGRGGERGWVVRHTGSSVWVWWERYGLGEEGRYLLRPRYGRQGRDVAGSAPYLDLSSLPAEIRDGAA